MSVKLASKKTDSEFALVRRRELPSGMNIKELALDLFEKFRIGKRNGKGVLILFVEKTKEVKIEVSYALEGILTDALCRRLENAAQTYFLSDIPQDYFSELLITMSNAVLEGQSPEEDLFPAASQFFLSGGGGLHSMIAGRNAEALLKLVRKISDESEKRYMPADIPEDSLGVYMKSLENGIGDPELPILSEGSMIFRIVVPRTRTQIRRLYSDYTRAGLDYFLKKEKEGLALAVFRQGKSVLPKIGRAHV